MNRNHTAIAAIVSAASMLALLGLFGSIAAATINANETTTAQKNTCIAAGGSYSFDNGGNMICTVK